ncbi:uncharacterized protein SOCEGT47_037740 [Sorangium cellulosum]|uniref:Uncharacterized protein n=1 Tax=Sorangium cellulosum TaxID=56 RepID=A0A4P2Q2C2_SORCE|nr:uncharacterized protein SOCEGT47_037740 [Sorangium cellulosum]
MRRSHPQGSSPLGKGAMTGGPTRRRWRFPGWMDSMAALPGRACQAGCAPAVRACQRGYKPTVLS